MSNHPETLPLFGEPEHAVARVADPETAHVAAESVDTKTLEKIIVCCLEQNPNGLTSYEIADMTGISLVTVSPRLRPLVRKGLAEDSGECRPTQSGRNAIVWKAAK